MGCKNVLDVLSHKVKFDISTTFSQSELCKSGSLPNLVVTVLDGMDNSTLEEMENRIRKFNVEVVKAAYLESQRILSAHGLQFDKVGDDYQLNTALRRRWVEDNYLDYVSSVGLYGSMTAEQKDNAYRKAVLNNGIDSLKFAEEALAATYILSVYDREAIGLNLNADERSKKVADIRAQRRAWEAEPAGTISLFSWKTVGEDPSLSKANYQSIEESL